MNGIRYIYNGNLVMEVKGAAVMCPLPGEEVAINDGRFMQYEFVVDHRKFFLTPSDAAAVPVIIEVYLKR